MNLKKLDYRNPDLTFKILKIKATQIHGLHGWVTVYCLRSLANNVYIFTLDADLFMKYDKRLTLGMRSKRWLPVSQNPFSQNQFSQNPFSGFTEKRERPSALLPNHTTNVSKLFFTNM
jgi:hypothetical protein